MKRSLGVIKSIVEITHVEFSTYDLRKSSLICTSGLAQKILGYTKEEFDHLRERFFENVIHPDDLEKVLDGIRHLQDSLIDEMVEVKARCRKADGGYLWIYSRRIVSHRDAQGRSMKITSISQDVTEAVELFEQLEQSIQTLNRISYKNSHDVRGPVATILGLVQLMGQRGFIDEMNKEYYEALRITIQKLDAIIHDINDMASETTFKASEMLKRKKLD